MSSYADFAKTYLGVKEGSTKHHYIIDEYNKIKPLPRNYKVKYTDSWCATFVSFVLNKCNAKNAPYECSCQQMYIKAKKNKQIVTTPKVNDIVLYDWGHNGSLDHVGIITSISGNTLTVIEGNKSNAVGYRTISKTNKSIAYYLRVPTTAIALDYNKIANDVIKGKYGNGAARKEALKAIGADYATVQKLVNEKVKK